VEAEPIFQEERTLVKLEGKQQNAEAILRISQKHGAPARVRGAKTDDTLPSLLVFSDAFSDHACVFLRVSMHLEGELMTNEEIPMQCGTTTQEWMATQYDQASDACMANRPNMRGNPTAHRTQPSLPSSQALAPCARQPGFRAI